MKKYEAITKVSLYKKEDGGCAMLLESDVQKESIDGVSHSINQDGFFVILQSWSDDKNHSNAESLIGKTVRVSVEIIEKWLVVGDHPILARPDKIFTNETEAKSYAEELNQCGYENISIKNLDKDESTMK